MDQPSSIDRPSRAARAGGAVIAALGAAALWQSSALAAPAPTWPVIGQQGMVRFVIVPPGKVTDRTAYEEQIARLCEPERTCFLNFYGNSTGAPATLPLPDAIEHEATATFRRSMKNGVQTFSWSCRLKVGNEPCF